MNVNAKALTVKLFGFNMLMLSSRSTEPVPNILLKKNQAQNIGDEMTSYTIVSTLLHGRSHYHLAITTTSVASLPAIASFIVIASPLSLKLFSRKSTGHAPKTSCRNKKL